jgi:hypothetical protein
MKKSIILIFLVLFAVPHFLYSQDDDKGLSHYIFPEFRKGKIKFKNLQVTEMMLNYNSVTEEMIFDSNGKKLAIADPMSIDTIRIQGRKFIPTQNIFYEVILESWVPLLIRHTATVISPGKPSGYGTTSQTSAITQKSSLVASRGIYEIHLPGEYEVTPETEFMIKQDSKIYKISNSNQVIKYFPEKKEAIREFVKKNRTSFKKSEDMKMLIDFCNK